jgi:2-methylisocitrate lyase-like PEP mutase family enzyme
MGEICMNDDKANRFDRLHRNGNCFIMANAWNAGSAVILEQAGFEAIGTTSAGIAYSHGLADAEAALSFESALQETREIASAVAIPVSMDSENAYADEPRAVFENLQRIAASGVVGASIEDYSGDLENPFYDLELAVERVRAAKDAVMDLGYPFVLTARAECYLYGHADPFRESVLRINRYREAGADCLYVPGIRDIQTIRDLVDATDGPLNVVMGLSGTPISLAELRQAGVARVSIGGSLARATLGLVRSAATEMLEQGSFGFASDQIPDAELCKLFSKQ